VELLQNNLKIEGFGISIDIPFSGSCNAKALEEKNKSLPGKESNISDW